MPWCGRSWRSGRSENALLTPSFVVLMAIAGMIAGIGIVLDSPILIIGAMVVGPDYAPVSAVCVFAVRRRWRSGPACPRHARDRARRGRAGQLRAGAPVRSRCRSDRTSPASPRASWCRSSPTRTPLGTYASLLAGVAGMLSLTEGRSGTLVGVLVSVTTIPAAANIGLAAAYGAGEEMQGAAAQLLLNVVALVLAGVTTLIVQDRLTTHHGRSPSPLGIRRRRSGRRGGRRRRSAPRRGRGPRGGRR